MRILGYDEDCISPEAYDLIEKLLDPNPKTRLGSNGAEEVKQHPFFQGKYFVYDQRVLIYLKDFAGKLLKKMRVHWFLIFQENRKKWKESVEVSRKS